jgi:hypothetical protein
VPLPLLLPLLLLLLLLLPPLAPAANAASRLRSARVSSVRPWWVANSTKDG